MASDFYNNSVFWVEVDRIRPNPFQPRREFNQDSLESLADSIRQYGVLSPIVVTRKETERSDGGITVEYELVAGERRLRAAKIARIQQIPCLIRNAEDSDKMKLEIAIIENLQREDLNPIDRALAFKKLTDEFKLKHGEIAKKVGKSREYVSNSLRLLALPEDMQRALVAGEINEGHTRPLLMLTERPEQQQELLREIKEKRLTVRESERIARGIATDRARKKDLPPELAALERELTERLGTRVQIETRENGGKVHIDFFSPTDIQDLLTRLASGEAGERPEVLSAQGERADSDGAHIVGGGTAQPEQKPASEPSPLTKFLASAPPALEAEPATGKQDAPVEGAEDSAENEATARPAEAEDEKEEEEDIYSIKNFTI
ncbi:MAG: ParB/RepB/Spo0J family partition protein [bacterium]|nr:ParB/RepB/Spo0J family partition protein [bacterium]